MNKLSVNKFCYNSATTLRTVAMLCSTGPLMQTFIEVLGFGSRFNYFHTSLIQIVNILIILLFSHFADTHTMLKRAAFTIIPMGILFLFYIPLCFIEKPSLISGVFLLFIALLQAVCYALYTVCEYKLPYHIFRPQDYGMALAVSGVMLSVCSLGFSSLITYFSSAYEYKNVMFITFIVSAIITVISGILYFYMRSLITDTKTKEEQKTKISTRKMFTYPIFYKLLVPNLMRGFSFGTTTVLTIVAFTLGYDEKVATLMVAVQSVAFLIGFALLGILSKYMKMKHILLLSALVFVVMPMSLIPSAPVFLTVYALLMGARTITDNAVPTVLLKAVPIEIAGPYNAWRMVLHTCGVLLATTVASIISPYALIWITTILHIAFALIYVNIKEIKNAE